MSEMVARLDDLGKPAWITLMVLGFIVFWPIGLGILAYLMWSGRMGCASSDRFGAWDDHRRGRWERKVARMQERVNRWGCGPARSSRGFAPSGNRAFDEYRDETLSRLEQEAAEFRDFLGRLRMAKDKAEFDQFMADRRSRPAPDQDRGSNPPDQG